MAKVHKELGFEKILLVEGPTEVPTIQQFLRKIKKDHQILLLPLHGHMPKADELEEILRITTDIAVLIDSEETSETSEFRKVRREFLNLCESRGLTSHAPDRCALQNYFPDSAIKRLFGGAFRALTPFEKLADVTPHWSKSQPSGAPPPFVLLGGLLLWRGIARMQAHRENEIAYL